MLRREMWQSVDLPPGMPLRPGPEDVALALHALMPRWQVQLSAGAGPGTVRCSLAPGRCWRAAGPCCNCSQRRCTGAHRARSGPG